MDNSNNPYAGVSNEGLLNNQHNNGPPQNQGFNPSNQGYVPPQAYNQGYAPNNYIPPPPPPPQPYNQGGQGFNPISGNIPCPNCHQITGSIGRKVSGQVTWIWCLVLVFFTGIFCCIPFCIDSCKDTEFVCSVCQFPKSRVKAKCI